MTHGNGAGTPGGDRSPVADRTAEDGPSDDRPAEDWPAIAAARPARACRVERVACADVDAHQAAWADLAARALEPNVFLEPAFALPLLRHVPTARCRDVLLVWDGSRGPGRDGAGRLIGLLPVALPVRWGVPGVVRGFAHRQVTLGTPLLDRERGAAAFAAMLDWLRVHTGAAALRLSAVVTQGAFTGALAGLRIERLDERRRAILLPGTAAGPADPSVADRASGRRGKELRRQRRRLSELGRRRYTSARSPAAVARATERFLALENEGWKGGRATALLADARLAAFARAMTALMARDGRCRIDAVEIDGRPVAMGIILTTGERAHFWKTTFDERHAPLSPGVQFALELTDALRGDPALALVDSCAVPDHPMIDRLWTGRLTVCDLLVAIDPARPGRFRRAVWVERAGHQARRAAKALRDRLRRLRGGKR